jgi:hypothetical protein
LQRGQAGTKANFLTDILCGLLSHTGPAGPADTFTISHERHKPSHGVQHLQARQPACGVEQECEAPALYGSRGRRGWRMEDGGGRKVAQMTKTVMVKVK